LHHKTGEILDKEDLEKLWTALKENISPPDDKKERINYNSFLTIASMLPIKVSNFFFNSEVSTLF
jgi:serine/threonine-protein phosphatase 2A regulatory subunit B''